MANWQQIILAPFLDAFKNAGIDLSGYVKMSNGPTTSKATPTPKATPAPTPNSGWQKTTPTGTPTPLPGFPNLSTTSLLPGGMVQPSPSGGLAALEAMANKPETRQPGPWKDKYVFPSGTSNVPKTTTTPKWQTPSVLSGQGKGFTPPATNGGANQSPTTPQDQTTTGLLPPTYEGQVQKDPSSGLYLIAESVQQYDESGNIVDTLHWKLAPEYAQQNQGMSEYQKATIEQQKLDSDATAAREAADNAADDARQARADANALARQAEDNKSDDARQAAADAADDARQKEELAAQAAADAADLAEQQRQFNETQSFQQQQLAWEQEQWNAEHPSLSNPTIQATLGGAQELSREAFDKLPADTQQLYLKGWTNRTLPAPWWYKNQSSVASTGGSWRAARQY